MAAMAPTVIAIAAVAMTPAVMPVPPTVVAMAPAAVVVMPPVPGTMMVVVPPAVLHGREAVRGLDRRGGQRRGLGGGRRREKAAGEREGRQGATAERTECGLRGGHGRSPDRVRQRDAAGLKEETGPADLNVG